MSLLCCGEGPPDPERTTLTVLILDALSDTAYQTALDNPKLLESALGSSESALYLHSIHEILLPQLSNGPVPKIPLRYQILMLEPVSHGYVQPGATRIIVIHSGKPNSHTSSITPTEQIDSEGIEIDEGFLANSIAPTALRLNGHSHNSELAINSKGSSGVTHITFGIEPLVFPVSASDDAHTLYIRTADLSRVGLLSEDWAVASLYPEMRYRMVRIIADDQLVKTPGTVCCSPLLLSNIVGFAEWPAYGQPPRLSLRPSPFGHRQPTIPVAKSVTIARIATPFSINRKYQKAYINTLKSYFASTKRLVKSRDIIALSLNCQCSAEWHGEEDEENSPDLQAGIVNEIVYFTVTNIEHSIVPGIMSTGDQDLYTGSVLGELGYWIDSSVTRLVQTGLEHARVPDMGSYLELDPRHSRSIISFLKRQPHSHLISQQSLYSKLLSLISASFTRHSVDYNLQLTVLLKGVRGIGKFSTISWVAQRLGIHILEVDCYNTVGENDVKTEGTLRARFEQAITCSPCILVLRNIEAFARTTQPIEAGKELAIVNILKECIHESAQSWKITGFPVVIVGTTDDPSRVSVSIISLFKHELDFKAPNEEDRLEILQALSWDTHLAPDVSLRGLAIQTAALVPTDLSDLISHARSSALKQAGGSYGLTKTSIFITAQDFNNALKKVRNTYSENIGAPKIPNVTWDDVGGLAHVKADILDTIQLPLEHPELFSDGLKKRSGILLYGPPGTGKTLVAKAVATTCSLNFFSVKGPELLNMYIGESEANVRKVFQKARDAKPCVIFFDELDSVAPKRGNHGDSGGVMDRIVSQLLAEVDGMSDGSSGTDIFVIGATNRPDLLDPALLRPGRFDRMLYLGLSESHQAQLSILEALTRKFVLHPGLDLKSIAELCPFNYTGADFYALCSDAMLNAMSRTAQQIEVKIGKLNEGPASCGYPYPPTSRYYLAELASPDELRVQVSKEDFLTALNNLVPSVTQIEMEHYAMVQRQFSQNIQSNTDRITL